MSNLKNEKNKTQAYNQPQTLCFILLNNKTTQETIINNNTKIKYYA